MHVDEEEMSTSQEGSLHETGSVEKSLNLSVVPSPVGTIESSVVFPADININLGQEVISVPYDCKPCSVFTLSCSYLITP